MTSSNSATVIFPLDFGAANKFEENDFPLAIYDGVSNIVNKGSLLLSATLDEMIKIKEMGIDLSSNPQFLLNTRLKYVDLAAKQTKLEKHRKSLNPIKYIRNYRAARMFYAAALSLRDQTLATSEQIQRKDREMREVPTTDIRTVDDAVRLGKIAGIAIKLPGPLNDEDKQAIIDAANAIAKHATDPFVDNPDVPQLRDDESFITLADTASLLTQDTSGSNPQEAEPMSPASPSYHFYFYNSVLTAGSNVHQMTLNQGSENRGPTIIEQPKP